MMPGIMYKTDYATVIVFLLNVHVRNIRMLRSNTLKIGNRNACLYAVWID